MLMSIDASKQSNVVFDTQIYLRAAINPNSACGRLLFEQRLYYQLYAADSIGNEIREVLRRPKIRLKFPQITDKRIEQVEVVLQSAQNVVVTEIEPICRDPKDDIFLACAKMANADYLVSEDNDLLVIGQYHETRIVNVASFLHILEQQRDQDT